LATHSLPLRLLGQHLRRELGGRGCRELRHPLRGEPPAALRPATNSSSRSSTEHPRARAPITLHLDRRAALCPRFVRRTSRARPPTAGGTRCSISLADRHPATAELLAVDSSGHRRRQCRPASASRRPREAQDRDEGRCGRRGRTERRPSATVERRHHGRAGARRRAAGSRFQRHRDPR